MTIKNQSPIQKMKILLIVGRKNAGKTSLIEKLLSGLKAKGHKLGSIKHTAHDHKFDREGTDSFRHAQAGAQTSLLISPNRVAFFSDTLENRNLHRLLSFLFGDCDLIIGEGFKGSTFPKIEILDSGEYRSPICNPEDNLIAVVCEENPGLPVPHFRRDQIDEIIKFVEEKFLNKAAYT